MYWYKYIYIYICLPKMYWFFLEWPIYKFFSKMDRSSSLLEPSWTNFSLAQQIWHYMFKFSFRFLVWFCGVLILSPSQVKENRLNESRLSLLIKFIKLFFTCFSLLNPYWKLGCSSEPNVVWVEPPAHITESTNLQAAWLALTLSACISRSQRNLSRPSQASTLLFLQSKWKRK